MLYEVITVAFDAGALLRDVLDGDLDLFPARLDRGIERDAQADLAAREGALAFVEQQDVAAQLV